MAILVRAHYLDKLDRIDKESPSGSTKPSYFALHAVAVLEDHVFLVGLVIRPPLERRAPTRRCAGPACVRPPHR